MAEVVGSGNHDTAPTEVAALAELSALGALRSVPSLSPLFRPIGDELLSRIEPMLEWFGVAAGTVLFREGDPAPDAYVVISGRLGVFVEAAADLIPVAQISPGEIVGEMSLISREPRSATVLALRDSEVVRLPRAAAARLMAANPQVGLFVMRLLAARLRERTRTRLLRQTIDSIAIVSLTEPPADPSSVKHLIEAFRQFGREIAVVDNPESERTSQAVKSTAAARPLVIYVAGRDSQGWARRCLRQSDRVVFVANAAASTVGASQWAIDYASALQRVADLVLVNDANSTFPAGGSDWLQHFSSDRILHVRRGNAIDFARVARLVFRQAIGLVLSGGGARAFAHIGVIKALSEAAIPIDLVAGTSMGALVAASVALGHPPGEMIEIFSRAFRRNPIADYTIPIVALARGRRMRRMLIDACGEALIENTWKSFFCVSVNLSRGEAMVHKEGVLWRALRASAAIPGVVPPMVMDGQLFVDGGVMNNFPASVMSSLLRGPVVGVEVTADWKLETQIDDIEEKSLLWLLRRGRRETPNILRILTRSVTINGDLEKAANRGAADVLIQPELSSIDILSFREFDSGRGWVPSSYRRG